MADHVLAIPSRGFLPPSHPGAFSLHPGCSGSLGLAELRCPESKAAEGVCVSGVQQGKEKCNQLRSELCSSQKDLGSFRDRVRLLAAVPTFPSLPAPPTLIQVAVELISGTEPVLGGKPSHGLNPSGLFSILPTNKGPAAHRPTHPLNNFQFSTMWDQWISHGDLRYLRFTEQP